MTPATFIRFAAGLFCELPDRLRWQAVLFALPITQQAIKDCLPMEIYVLLAMRFH
jgi:hypothetical protein